MSQFKNKLAFGFLALLGVAVGVGSYLYFKVLTAEELTPLEAAEIVPEEAFMASYISTDSKGWSKLEEFGTPEAQQLLQEHLTGFSTDMTSGNSISYKKDIKPWLGGVMLAFLPSDTVSSNPNTEDPNILLVIGIKNKLKALQFTQKLDSQGDKELEKTPYSGVTIFKGYSNNEPFYAALLEDEFILAFYQDTIEQAIDTWKGQPSFASKAQAKTLLNNTTDLENPLFQFYFPNYGTFMQEELSNSPEATEIPLAWQEQLASVESVVLAMGVNDSGLHFQAVAQFDPTAIPVNLEPTNNDIIAQIPANTIALISGQGISQGWSEFTQQANKDPDLQEIVNQGRQLFQSVNLDLDQDILAWMNGEFAIGIIATDSGIASSLGFGGMAILETKNPSQAKQTLNKLQTLLETTGLFLPQQTQIKGTEITEWLTPQQQVAFSYGWLNNNSLLMTLGTPATEILSLPSGESLAKNPKFTAMTQDLPPDNFGYLYLNMESSLAALNRLPIPERNTYLSPEADAMLDWIEDVILNSIEGVAITSTITNSSTSQLDMILGLKENSN